MNIGLISDNTKKNINKDKELEQKNLELQQLLHQQQEEHKNQQKNIIVTPDFIMEIVKE
jgi:hypothetical protein